MTEVKANPQAQENYFQVLYDKDLRDKVKKKNNLSYISWAAAWAEVKKVFPDATYREYERPYHTVMTTTETVDENGVTTRVQTEVPQPARFWFDDGKTGWVKVGVTINGIDHIENYPIMDHRNQPIPADKITCTDANKAKMRALAKACGRHGLGLYIYEGEDMPEAAKKEVSSLAAARKKVIAAAKSAVTRGVNRDSIYHLIGEMNDGNEDPNKIASTSICQQLIDAIAAMKPTK